MNLLSRKLENDDDYWRLRAFLRDVFILNDYHEWSWQTARLDYWRFFGNENFEHYRLEDAITLWETEDGRIAAFVTPESRGHAYLQVHPAFRSRELELMMLSAAEATIAEPSADGDRELTVWAHVSDTLRVAALEQSGYLRGDWREQQFRRCLQDDLPEPQPTQGYWLRSLGDSSEIADRSWVSWRAFHPDAPDHDYFGWAWYEDIQRCPLYRRDLDLVAVAPNGDLAAFCTVWYDDVTRTGYFEPVGTSPDHQRKGLGKALMIEGMRRLKRLGGRYATVAGSSGAAVGLYASVMSPGVDVYERWRKTL